MDIDFQDNTNSVLEDEVKLITGLLEIAAKKEAVPNHAEVSVTFVNNKEIQEINRDYRNLDKPTDVISFALEETADDEVEIVGEDLPVVLGDIIISVERAKEQAADYKHSYERELGFLAVHGFLHLLGYDHMTKEDEKVMFQKQEEILGEFNLGR
ncbi:rRNA maturation RNase YbeY [Ornithinibacillus massiliensis]|uniref:Endoribonuclease YbeY n=1 Tax=Ornithinibacillus massiliensis TaxID=1944633 RepID=A0ABS5MCB4_9BACI|nr:rRNA maturation RNase YbeY [Ornithinibacillus massiliensis]MBS3679547.1 rRNA maturation RNase YbeY [Ornithinibacillus massiliensis]